MVNGLSNKLKSKIKKILRNAGYTIRFNKILDMEYNQKKHRYVLKVIGKLTKTSVVAYTQDLCSFLQGMEIGAMLWT